MSKFKLLLLGGILSFVGIFNFSSAENYYGMSFSCSVGGEISGYNQCDDDYLIFENPIVGNYLFSVSSSLEGFSTQLSVTNGAFNDVPGIGDTVLVYYFPGNLNLYCSEGGCQQLNMYAYGNVAGSTPALITYTVSPIGGEGGGGDSGGSLIIEGTGAFAPIVGGLTNTVEEFIPYVVYIGLGILSVVIGFFAIKRLMKYVFGNTYSVFKSRRKK